MKYHAFPVLLWSIGLFDRVSASYARNLAYRSPSQNHPGLGINIPKVVKRSDPAQTYGPDQLNFTHGIASGDPSVDSVILWTRVAPTFDNDNRNDTVSGPALLFGVPDQNAVKTSTSPISVDWKIATDRRMKNIASSGTVFTSSDVDYTVKVDPGKLKPFTTYYYQFAATGSSTKVSSVGTTRTLPREDDQVTKINLAVFSCSNYPFGYFNAYGNPARKASVDYVVHLGDYIYEYANGEYGWGQSIDRVPLPDRQIFTLYDYRKRHATYRNDPDLQLSTSTFPWIPVWDDHEVADNTYRDGMSKLNNTEGSFLHDGGISVDQRKLNAVRAYWEWMPIRQVELDDNLRIWRSFSFGNLMDLMMLDTRHYDRSITDLYWNTDYIHAISNDAGRSLMGSRQENWLYRNLIHSRKRGATWRIIGSQIVFSHLNLSIALGPKNPSNYDAWDGYQANRNRTFKVLYDNNIGNNIFLSGDSHANWVSDLVWLGEKPYDPKTGAGSIGVEFGGTAVTSPSPAGANVSIASADLAAQWLVGANPELHFSELYYRGYYELQISQKEVKAYFYGMPTVVTRNSLEVSVANFTVKNGENKLQRPVGAGVVESGALKGGQTRHTNLTRDTVDNTWATRGFPLAVLK